LKIQLRTGNGRIARPQGLLIVAFIVAAFSVMCLPFQARADQPATAARSSGAPQGASVDAVSGRVARAQPPMADTYGARGASSKDLARLKGGDHVVVIAGSTVVIVLLVVLVVILL